MLCLLFRLSACFLICAAGFGAVVATRPARLGDAIPGIPAAALQDYGSLSTPTLSAQAAPSSVPAIDTTDRAAMRNFWNTYYQPDVAIDWTGNIASALAGTTSQAFKDRVLLRVNFYRALVGASGTITFDDVKNQQAQAAAVLMSLNDAISHSPPSTWPGWSASAATGASSSNLALGNFGAASIDAYMSDDGDNNTAVGHRTWICLPQTLTMGTGDCPGGPIPPGGYVPPSGVGYYSQTNALYVAGLLANTTRPSTRDAFMAWPNAGFAFSRLMCSRWSFAYPDADVSAATVTAVRNGTALTTKIIARTFNYNDRYVVFTLSDASGNLLFDGGAKAQDQDVPITITISNLVVGGKALSVTYSVTPFDPTSPDPSAALLAPTARQVFTRADAGFSYAIHGGPGYTYSCSNLPSGLTLNAQTGQISGTAAVPGTYSGTVKISGASGTAVQPFTIVVTPPLKDTRLVNLSLRSDTTPGDRIAIAGFVIGGAQKTVLVRLSGPALVQFGVSGTLVRPQLNFYHGQSLVLSAESWSTSADSTSISQASGYAGAFAFADGSADAACIVTLDPGDYTVQAIGVGGGSGVGLVELYDLDRGAGVLVNMSTRAFVGTDDKILINGLSVEGTQSKRFLIRGIGPTLTVVGVPGALADPILTVFDSNKNIIATNDNWGSNGEETIANAALQVGAFALPSGSLDATLLLTLPPGNYTIQVSGKNRTTGIGLAEVYAMPAP